ncbi:unnamed protein product [Effrenium voratum]|uniref:Uncharacterized protein n=1 Tax=Effrenium voratum TaxID=2562239 RepID=A0AA36I8U2_9DINO|nr:unnamed protein product [Effrenium voratum]
MSPAGCIIEVAPESYALGCEPGKATVLRTGEHGITAVKDAEGEWRLLLAEASPLLLPKLCGALAKTQAVLFAVKPSKAAFLCPKTQLRLAAKAVLGCGCGLRLSGTNLHPPSTSTRTQRDVGVWFRGDSRGLWRLEVGGFFVEIPGRRPGKVGPRSVEMRAACGGVILDGSRLPVIASPQRLLTEGEKLDQGWDLLCRGKYLALELEDEKRHGIWLFCGGFFGRVLGPAVGPDSVVQPDLEIEATVGEVKSPGVFQDASGLMLGSFKLEDQQLQHTLPSGEVQNWKVRGMTFNPLAEAPEVDLSEGAKVKYWSVTVQKWIPATILSKNQDGSFRLDLKKRALRCHIGPFYKAEGDAPTPGRVTTSKKTKKKQETSSEVSSSASPSSASKAKRKAGKRKAAREKERERKEKEKKQKEKSKQKRLQLEREKQKRLKEKTQEKRLKEKAKEKKEEEKRLKQKAKEKKQERETKAKEKGKKKGKETKVKSTKKTGHTPKKEHGLERKSKNTNPKNKKQRKREESDQEESDQEESEPAESEKEESQEQSDPEEDSKSSVSENDSSDSEEGEQKLRKRKRKKREEDSSQKPRRQSSKAQEHSSYESSRIGSSPSPSSEDEDSSSS